MRKINVLSLLAIVLLGTTLLSAQASRTWVSGVGDDANPCSRTAPCKTFAGAISKTAAGGEIDALDPGGFGALTITKALTIDGGGGQVASVLVAGTNGIVVAAGPNDVVILRNLRINGISGSGNGGLNGIRFLSGKDLNVENVYIFGFTQNGIDIALGQASPVPEAHILNSVIKNVGGVGIRAANTAGLVQVGIHDTDVILSTTGIEAAQHAHVVVSRAVVENGSTAGLLADDSASLDAQLSVDHSDVAFNGDGLKTGTGGALVFADCKIAYNTGFGANQTGTTITSYGSSRMHSNGSGNGTFQGPIPQQ